MLPVLRTFAAKFRCSTQQVYKISSNARLAEGTNRPGAYSCLFLFFLFSFPLFFSSPLSSFFFPSLSSRAHRWSGHTFEVPGSLLDRLLSIVYQSSRGKKRKGSIISFLFFFSYRRTNVRLKRQKDVRGCLFAARETPPKTA